MDYKKTKAPTNTVTRDIMNLCEETGNIYESVAIIGKRANRISAEIKQELNQGCRSLPPPMTPWRKSLRIASRRR